MVACGTRFVARLMAVAAAAALLLAARAVAAEVVDPRVTEAARQCADGDARVGVALLMRVHVDTLEPRYVLDQAACLERNGQPAAAAERLQFYLRLQNTVAEGDRGGVGPIGAGCEVTADPGDCRCRVRWWADPATRIRCEITISERRACPPR
jgi:hypothetical protein